jgi:hypothetical protein
MIAEPVRLRVPQIRAGGPPLCCGSSTATVRHQLLCSSAPLRSGAVAVGLLRVLRFGRVR